MKSKTQQIKFKGLAIIFLSCFFVLMSLSGEGQISSQSYKIYFSSDRDGIGIYETNTNGDYVKKLSHLDYSLLPMDLCISDDFSKLAFSSYLIGENSGNVYLINKTGTLEINLTIASGVSKNMYEGAHFFSFDWIYFSSDRSNNNGWFEAYRMKTDGSNVQPVSPTYSMYDPSTMSPDQAFLLLEHANNWNLNSHLYVINPDGSNPQLIYDSPSNFGRMRGAAWLPNTNKIVFSGGSHEGNHSLFIINPDGSGLNVIGIPSVNNWPFGQYRWGMRNKFYTGDGQKIVFSANYSGNYDIFIQNIDGTGLIQLTTESEDDKNAIITPDDQKILWIKESGGNRMLYIMDIDGTNKKMVKEDLGNIGTFVLGEQEPNLPPLAVCRDITINAGENCTVSILPTDVDGGSYDPDGDNIELSLDNSGPFQLGEYRVNLTVTDEKGESDTCSAKITVLDQLPPVPDLLSLPEVRGECNVSIVDIPTATDNCMGKIFGVTNDPLYYNSQGAYTINWIYDDGNNNFSYQSQQVLIKDTTNPVIEEISGKPSVLWPPNHKMIPVIINVITRDNCDPKPDSQIVKVSSNEPINGTGDSNTSPDWEITGKLTLNLRAERSGTGNGRIYTVTVQCKDTAGNSVLRDIEILVPHDKK